MQKKSVQLQKAALIEKVYVQTCQLKNNKLIHFDWHVFLCSAIGMTCHKQALEPRSGPEKWACKSAISNVYSINERTVYLLLNIKHTKK